ncbi:MAG: hypothetical protein PHW22_03715 [Bacilli bacterium]|nr:hypothetical protein [Bacilli bacterium]
MKDYIKWLDNSPIIIKIILALPGLDGIIWGLYRLFKGIVHNSIFAIILGIVWIFAGFAILWIIDLLTLIFTGKVIFD